MLLEQLGALDGRGVGVDPDVELIDVAAKSQELPRDTQGNLILPDRGAKSKDIEV